MAEDMKIMETKEKEERAEVFFSGMREKARLFL
jgi:hypothetical protein